MFWFTLSFLSIFNWTLLKSEIFNNPHWASMSLAVGLFWITNQVTKACSGIFLWNRSNLNQLTEDFTWQIALLVSLQLYFFFLLGAGSHSIESTPRKFIVTNFALNNNKAVRPVRRPTPKIIHYEFREIFWRVASRVMDDSSSKLQLQRPILMPIIMPHKDPLTISNLMLQQMPSNAPLLKNFLPSSWTSSWNTSFHRDFPLSNKLLSVLPKLNQNKQTDTK